MLQELAVNNQNENIKRSVKGALWVLQTSIGNNISVRSRTESNSSVASATCKYPYSDFLLI